MSLIAFYFRKNALNAAADDSVGLLLTEVTDNNRLYTKYIKYVLLNIAFTLISD